MEEDNESEPDTDDESEPDNDDVEDPEEEEVTLQKTYQCLAIYIKAFQMLVLLNPMSTSLSTTCMIVMMILQLIAKKRQMIPTTVSCMHLNFN